MAAPIFLLNIADQPRGAPMAAWREGIHGLVHAAVDLTRRFALRAWLEPHQQQTPAPADLLRQNAKCFSSRAAVSGVGRTATRGE